MTHNGKILAEGIIALSEPKEWAFAKLEWEVEDIFLQDDLMTCLCTHHPIKELCYLYNTVNGNRTLVGNVCVNKFMGLPSGKIFSCIKRVTADNSRPLNAETLSHAWRKRWLTAWEFTFYKDTYRKRVLSDRQHLKRVQINKRVLNCIRKSVPKSETQI